MPDAFDPYFKWLGIPKSDQPPHAYRLLGIELFESDADVISNAADGRMAQIKNFQTGKFGAVSQKLLNEIAAAKVCLLRPEKKAEYDQRLRTYLRKRDAAAVEVREPVVVQAVAAPVESDEGLSFLDHASVPMCATAHSPVRKKKSGWLVPAVFGFGSLALVSGAVAYVVFTGVGKDNPPNSQTAQLGDSGRGAKNSAAKSSENSPAAASSASPRPTGSAPAARDSGHPSTPRPTAASPSISGPNKSPKPKSDFVAEADTTSPEHGPGKAANEKPEDRSPAAQPPPNEVKPVKKPPLPEPAQFQAMKTEILGIFHKEYSEAKTADAKMALAAKLDAQADNFKGDPAERYSLWRMAAEEECEAGDVSSAMAIADKIQSEFDGDAESFKADLLAKGSGRAAGTLENARGFCDTAMKLAAAAVGRDDYDAAIKYAKAAIGLTRRVKDPQFSRELGIQERAIEHRKSLYANVEKAMEVLNANRDDPAANLTVGNWRCFVKGDWEKGLPYLAKGSRLEHAALAKRELAKPADGREQVAIADDWWALGDKERDFKPIYRAHAIVWYEKAAPRLSGLDKVRVDKLLEAAGQASSGEANTSVGPKSFGPRGNVQRGNVALASNGATVTGMTGDSTKMIDQANPHPTSSTRVPCEIVISLHQVYQLQQIRFHFQPGTSAAYQILISRDGRKYDLLQDRSGQQQKDWQEFLFAARPVKNIKITSAGPNADVCIDDFEAYCYPISADGTANPRARRGGK